MPVEPTHPSATPPQAGYPAVRKAARALLIATLVFSALWYHVHLVSMAAHTAIPFGALVGVGLVLGLLFRKARFVPWFLAWWVVFVASAMRRLSLADVPIASQLFDGALLGYSAGSVWLAEILRLAVYFWALWLGRGLSRRVRRAGAEGVT